MTAPGPSTIDPDRLRTERLHRLQDAMRAHDLDGCLLLHDPNVRYATGASAMPVWSMSTFTRCAVVPAEGTPILFEHPNSVHRSALRAPDVRPTHAWEYLATNTLCSGPNTNPWRAEATDRVLRPGELVFIDTDTVGVEGCFFCVSRTFAVGGAEPSRAARATFRAAHDWVREMTALVRPGITCAELAAAAPRIPERFLPQRYEVMLHGVGLEDESPSVGAPVDPQPNGD